ncbi:hypothetical protein [Halodurantibacterium flavum]|uniref:Lipoprotein n=1 Tax=Halodurantibacterium flavum TaxID=1382802 RepID=A0ABW4S628_9RHOB
MRTAIAAILLLAGCAPYTGDRISPGAGVAIQRNIAVQTGACRPGAPCPRPAADGARLETVIDRYRNPASPASPGTP